MLGGIYSDQRCHLCGGKFKDDGRKALRCPKHPDQIATAKFRIKFTGNICKEKSACTGNRNDYFDEK